jgi:hypothetical protein
MVSWTKTTIGFPNTQILFALCIGDYVERESSRTLRARGDLLVEEILVEGLFVSPDTETHPLHANILGWPAEKAKIRLAASKLADKARLLLKPPKP